MSKSIYDRKKVAELANKMTSQGIEKGHAWKTAWEHVRNTQTSEEEAMEQAQSFSHFFDQEYEDSDPQIDRFMDKLSDALRGVSDASGQQHFSNDFLESELVEETFLHDDFSEASRVSDDPTPTTDQILQRAKRMALQKDRMLHKRREQNVGKPIPRKEYEERQIRRICLYGGPGSGKSQTAAWLYSALKERFIQSDSGIHIEQAQEYVKRWAYQGVKIDHFDQIYIFGKQMRTVELPLRNGVDLVITDSPMPLQVCFSQSNDLPYARDLESQAMWFEKAYPAIHIFVNRDGRKYYPGGRYESESEALDMDRYIKRNVTRMLREYSDNGRLSHEPELWEVSYKDKESMLNLILKHL